MPIPQQVYGYAVRNPYKSEDTWFAMNTNVTGMAAEDGRIVLNPYSGLSDENKAAVAKNEAIRLFMRENKVDPQFKVTPQQAKAFQGTAYATNEPAMRQTLVSRILTGDPSAGSVTEEQRKAADQIKKQLYSSRKNMVEGGNIDINKRPVVNNADGSISTLRSISIGTERGEVLIPTISDGGEQLSNERAIDQFRKTGRHLGVFSTPEAASQHARSISERQAQFYNSRK
jgi:hypothetical protein